MRVLITALVLMLGAPIARGECPLRLVEPRLEDLEAAASDLSPESFGPALSSLDAPVHDLAVVARWFAVRGGADEEQRTRTTLDLLDVWAGHRPAGRLLRRERDALEAEGWPVPARTEIDRALARLGDRGAVLARTQALLDSPSPTLRQLRQAQRGVTVMALTHDPEALAVLGRVFEALEEYAAADETVLFRAEAGDPEALTRLAAAYRRSGPQSCADAAALAEVLFSRR